MRSSIKVPMSFPRFALFDVRSGLPLCHQMSDGNRSLTVFGDEQQLRDYRYFQGLSDCPTIRIENVDQLDALQSKLAESNVAYVTSNPTRHDAATRSTAAYLEAARPQPVGL